MDVLVIGASVRAAAGSLRRAGRQPISFDLYGDLDLASTCASTRLDAEGYPGNALARISHLAVMPWLYTGAIENHPDVVAAISERFPLLGNPDAVLRRVRDPMLVTEVARRAGWLAPDARSDPQGVPTDGSWLVKPVCSGGGEGIAPWRGVRPANPDRVYHQARVIGRSLAATFVRVGSETRMVGVTRQYHGRVGNRFAYRGSLGPWPVADSTRRAIDGLGRTVAESFDLRGIFGLDLIEAAGRPWLIEVNPRYTASVEVLESALGRSIMAEHLEAFSATTAPTPMHPPAQPTPRVVAKAILFARRDGTLIEPIPLPSDDVVIADIPHPGTRFQAGEPVMTIFGQGDTVGSCRIDLIARLRTWEARIDVARRGSNLRVDDQKQRHRQDQETEDHPRQADRLP